MEKCGKYRENYGNIWKQHLFPETRFYFLGVAIYVCSLAIFVDDHLQRIKCWLKTHIPPSDPGVARMDGMFIVGVLSNRPAAQSWSKGDPQGTSTYLAVTTMIFTDKTLDLSVTYASEVRLPRKIDKCDFAILESTILDRFRGYPPVSHTPKSTLK